MDKFSDDVAKRINYYVYRLIDPRDGQTFYVGKGKGNRVFNHVQSAIGYYEGAEKDVSDDDPNKLRIIKEIRNEGLDVIHVIQRWNLTEKEAFEVESALIDAYAGLSNLQSGHHSEYGVTNASTLQKRLSLKEYAEPEDFKYIIIKIRQWRLDELTVQYPDPARCRYEATRYAWKIKKPSVEEYPYVFSVTDGIVKEVYKVDNWYYVPERLRYAFEGHVADDIRNKYVDTRIPERYSKKGMASPVLFSKNDSYTE